MALLDYRNPKTRRVFRIAAALVLALGLGAIFAGTLLTQHIIATAQTFPDAAHHFFVPDRYFTSFGLGFARNLALIVGAVLTVTSLVLLCHRELRWWFWDRYLQK